MRQLHARQLHAHHHVRDALHCAGFCGFRIESDRRRGIFLGTSGSCRPSKTPCKWSGTITSLVRGHKAHANTQHPCLWCFRPHAGLDTGETCRLDWQFLDSVAQISISMIALVRFLAVTDLRRPQSGKIALSRLFWSDFGAVFYADFRGFCFVHFLSCFAPL